VTQGDDDLETLLIGAVPNLRAFANSLCGDPTRADDLAQETLVKAWTKLASVEKGIEPQSLAVHDPSQHLFLGIAQASPRSRGCKWRARLCFSERRIAIAHRLSTLRSFDRILVVQNGQVVQDSRPDALVSKSGAYKSLVDLEFDRLRGIGVAA